MLTFHIQLTKSTDEALAEFSKVLYDNLTKLMASLNSIAEPNELINELSSLPEKVRHLITRQARNKNIEDYIQVEFICNTGPCILDDDLTHQDDDPTHKLVRAYNIINSNIRIFFYNNAEKYLTEYNATPTPSMALALLIIAASSYLEELDTRIKEIGEGAWGKVYTVNLDGIAFIVKEQTNDKGELPLTKNESHITSLYRASLDPMIPTDTKEEPLLILKHPEGTYETYMVVDQYPGAIPKSLQDTLNNGVTLPPEILYAIFIGIIGLHGGANSTPAITHGDISPSNILHAGPPIIVKFIDFGASEIAAWKNDETTHRITMGCNYIHLVFAQLTNLDSKDWDFGANRTFYTRKEDRHIARKVIDWSCATSIFLILFLVKLSEHLCQNASAAGQQRNINPYNLVMRYLFDIKPNLAWHHKLKFDYYLTPNLEEIIANIISDSTRSLAPDIALSIKEICFIFTYNIKELNIIFNQLRNPATKSPEDHHRIEELSQILGLIPALPLEDRLAKIITETKKLTDALIKFQNILRKHQTASPVSAALGPQSPPNIRRYNEYPPRRLPFSPINGSLMPSAQRAKREAPPDIRAELFNVITPT